MSYHFQLAADLAWFASNTHLRTLTVLRGYLKDYTTLKIWRLIGMIVLGALLFAATLLSANPQDYLYYGCPALCLTQDVSGLGEISQNDPLDFAQLVFMVWLYSAALIPLFTPSRAALNLAIQAIRKGGNRMTNSKLARVPGFVTVNLLVKALYLLISSTTFNVSYHIAWYIIGQLSLWGDWTNGQYAMNSTPGSASNNQTETTWGFGQFMSVLLLVLYVLAGIDIFSGYFHTRVYLL